MSGSQAPQESGRADRRKDPAAFIEEGERLCARLRELALKKHNLLLSGLMGEQGLEGLERIQDEEASLLPGLSVLAEQVLLFSGAAAGGLPSGAAEQPAGWVRLRAALEELQDLNRKNGALLQGLRDYVGSALPLLQRCAEGELYRQVGNREEVEKVTTKRNRFDRQA